MLVLALFSALLYFNLSLMKISSFISKKKINNRCGCIFSKMDKALFDLNWLIAHPKTLVEFLPPGVLDHAAFSISFASKI